MLHHMYDKTKFGTKNTQGNFEITWKSNQKYTHA